MRTKSHTTMSNYRSQWTSIYPCSFYHRQISQMSQNFAFFLLFSKHTKGQFRISSHRQEPVKHLKSTDEDLNCKNMIKMWPTDTSICTVHLWILSNVFRSFIHNKKYIKLYWWPLKKYILCFMNSLLLFCFGGSICILCALRHHIEICHLRETKMVSHTQTDKRKVYFNKPQNWLNVWKTKFKSYYACLMICIMRHT